uniref:Regulator of G protein signaling 19 n=1 Tax=Sus scrofa TaxID=9823 RepID=A0A8D1P425_PIG
PPDSAFRRPLPSSSGAGGLGGPRSLVDAPQHRQSWTRSAEPSWGHGHTPSYAGGPLISTSSPPATPSHGEGRGGGGGGGGGAARRAVGGARSRPSAGRGGARRAGRAGPGRAPPRARKSRPRALGKCGRGACALHPAPAPRRSGRTSERAGRRLRRERLGSAAGECARARRRDRGPAPPARGPRGRAGREPGKPAPGSAPQGLPPRGPRGPWAAERLGPVPARGGGGVATGFPFFCSSKPGEVIAQRGGPEEPRFPRLPPPPLCPVGRGRGGTPGLPPPPPGWIWQPLNPASRRGGAAPPARADRGLLEPASLRNAREDLLPSDLSPAAAVHAPSAARVGPRANLAPPAPTSPLGRWNEERRRAWRASRESRPQPLPSCEVCATPSPEEVQSWAQSFDKLMRSPAGRGAFRAFLRTEYSEENMLFWLACEELKAEADRHAVDEKARLIYEDYVSILSPKEVSLDSRVREGINKKMQEPSAHTFDDAQLQIYTLMHRDSYPRFLTSPAYRALLLQGGSPSSTEA